MIKLDWSNYEMWSTVKGHKKNIIDEEPKDKVEKYVNWEEDNNIVME